GERLSARIVAAAIRNIGLRAKAIDATELVVTDDNFGDATPDSIETNLKVQTRLLPLLRDGVIPVVTGFIGATPQGVMTTLGRGGSDYSGGILGAALNADEVIIWTDVNGFMTADPNLVPDAQTIPQISYSEAAELSYYGAKVLHPKTLLPLAPAKIPLYIKNSFEPDHPGTHITSQTGGWNADIKAITAIKNLSLVTISGSGMMGVPGIAAKTFSAVASQSINVLMISQSSSENNLCFIVDSAEAERTRTALRKALDIEFHHRHIENITVTDGIAIVAAVGEQMHGRPGIAARVFSAVADAKVNVIAIAQGSSEINISFVVDAKDVPAAVVAMHKRFELGNGK
ncbi:MAG TPA: aspartate kinase, partial [Acidobacteriota bacterium]|nr:aspartate kinase [Acidobacteriota bacterium]